MTMAKISLYCILKKYCWYFSDWVWWSYNCYNVSTKKTNNAATKKTNPIATDVTSTASVNCHKKKVKDCYIFCTVLLVIISLLLIFICYYYVK